MGRPKSKTPVNLQKRLGKGGANGRTRARAQRRRKQSRTTQNAPIIRGILDVIRHFWMYPGG